VRAFSAGLVLSVVVAFGAGCGPVQYISQVTQRASMEVAAAKSANADKLAPYEYTTAELYLHKAREEAGYSDYQAAIRFGKKAELMARKARRLAADSQGQPSPPDDVGEPIDPSASPSTPPPPAPAAHPSAPATDEGK
jgi:hypothetical protein